MLERPGVSACMASLPWSPAKRLSVLSLLSHASHESQAAKGFQLARSKTPSSQVTNLVTATLEGWERVTSMGRKRQRHQLGSAEPSKVL